MYRVLRRTITPLMAAVALSSLPAFASSGGGLTWHQPARPPQAWSRVAVAVGTDGNIYAFGGSDGSSTDYATTYIYHPTDERWTNGAPMPAPVEGAQAVTLPDGRIVVMGGGSGCHFTNNCPIYNAVLAYNPRANSWSQLAPMLSACYLLCAGLGPDSRIYAIGGWNGHSALASIEAYNPHRNTWSYAGRLPEAVEGHACASDPRNGRIYVIGGAIGGAVSNTLWIYDGRRWTIGTTMYALRSDAAATWGADGRIYVAGGFDGQVGVASVEAYDPRTNCWKSVASLPQPEYAMGLVTVPSGQIYTVGGNPAQLSIYGPTISLSRSSGRPGARVALTGSGFAANAVVKVYWGAPKTGRLLAIGRTDDAGALRGALSILVPSSAPGRYRITAVDGISRYPVNAGFAVTGPARDP